MFSIEDKLYKLNIFCEKDHNSNNLSDVYESVSAIIKEIRKSGYKIITPYIELNEQDINKLSEKGKLLYYKRIFIRSEKNIAIKEELYGFAAQLREIEKSLIHDVMFDYIFNTSKEYLKLSDINKKEIIYHCCHKILDLMILKY